MGDRNRQAWSDRFTSLLAIVESAQELCHDNAATPDQALDEVSNSEKRRFEARIDDPRRLWKLCHSARRQYDYPLARHHGEEDPHALLPLRKGRVV